MVIDEKLQKKHRETAAKLKPRPVELPSGKWRCQVMVDGKRVSVTAETPKEAHAQAVALRAGLINKPTKETITLEEAAQEYISSREAALSPPTIKGYKVIIKEHCKDLQKKKVADIDEAALQAEIKKLAEKDLSVKTIKNVMGFYIAVITMYHPINHKKLNYGQHVKKEHAFLEEKEIVSIISAAVGDEFEIPILLGLWLGLRRSEICGLTWENIDFERKTVSIVATKLVNADNEYKIIQRTKTEGSRRTVSCPDYILEKLKQYQPDAGKRVGPVFDVHPNSIYRAVKRVSEKAGVKFVGVHGLRHTNATVMASLGLVDKAVMARGGWSSDRVLKDVYEHLFSSSRTDADQAVNSYFEAAIPDLHTNLHTELSDT